ncbi:MAG: adenosylcobinamide-GDP ribazoletransferase [Bacteroidales bacterium]|nr:adenosylcobinamide-GDP ribazoletransferase [Bacteroidales bacterium]
MIKQIKLFGTAIVFFTRIPLPASLQEFKNLDQASRYFPLVGWIVGGFGALVYSVAALGLPHNISLILSMIGTIWITGAFHEDGLADVCDAFGGGWEKKRILEIMKDSRIGTYGTVGLIMSLALKFFLLYESPSYYIPIILISAHSISRFAAVTFMYTHEYVSEDATSKSKSIVKKMKLKELIVAGVFGLLPLAMFFDVWYLLLIFPVILAKALLANWFQKWIGGYTGDCLGTTQQITEIVFLISGLSLWRFI